MDQWLALLILGDLDPYTPTITPRVSLPTRSTKSQITESKRLLLMELEIMNARGFKAVGWIALVAFALAGCTSQSAGPVEGSTVEMMADYPTYDQEALVEQAALIIEGTVLATAATVLKATYEGDAPQENPLVGLSEKEKQRALDDDDGIPATAVTVRVDSVHKGDVEPGDEIVVVETGGVINGVTYKVQGVTSLNLDESYLLFGAGNPDGTYSILGGSAGTFVEGAGPGFVAVEPSSAPFEELTADKVDSLVSGITPAE